MAVGVSPCSLWRGAGGSAGRVSGTAFGPLQDLLVASDALAMVGSAGSSFSEVLASLLTVESQDNGAGDTKVLIRTPFVKSSQVKTLSCSEICTFETTVLL